MSPLQIGALVSGIVFGAAKVMVVLMELVAGEILVPVNVGVLITIGTTVSWIAFFSAYNCQRLIGHLDKIEARLHRDIPGYGQLCTEDGRVDAAREYARNLGAPTQRNRVLVPVD
jgi:hypothetical protein